ncbi:hypothetical protein CB0940_00048 [Cercospora beticola]|uniref:Myb-like domain-containing protein n=1 Tax=Cercospora beticola TaxID=122368 RepID=A0A2G5IAD6_CERBT|nr:hypothetical protein CB0940_00048 [Cercospora beticola]PIB01816.1 hypothetical protein CB0940_00048 [Cercospora beticola]WPA95452.1 hypothetical protein RHO25_000051 [Cercospora beticola]CAK1356333.1 unnamed protein product [Cercospora beticola]
MSFTLFPYRSIAAPKMYLVDSDTGQPLNRSMESLQLPSASAIADAEIRRDRRGKLVMVRHKGSSIINGGGIVAGTEVITFEDIKKSVNKMKEQESGEEKKSVKDDGKSKKEEKGSKEGKPSNDQKKGGKDNAQKAEGKPGNDFTPEEDAKLRELKEPTSKGGSRSWKDIAEEMGKGVDCLKARWNEIKDAGKAGGGESNDKKDNENKPQEQKKGEGKGKGKGNKGAKENEDAGKNNNNGGGQQKLDKFVFTEAEDSELRDQMQAGSTWKIVAKALKKPQEACKKRWDEIGGDAAKEEPKKDEPPKQEKTTNAAEKKDNAKKEHTKQETAKKPASVVKKASSRAGSVAGSVRSTRSSVKFSIREWRALQEDDFFSFDELQLLCQLIGKHGEASWLGIASAFHDKTGRRVHPDDIREKFEAIGKTCI